MYIALALGASLVLHQCRHASLVLVLLLLLLLLWLLLLLLLLLVVESRSQAFSELLGDIEAAEVGVDILLLSRVVRLVSCVFGLLL
jgi:hypothetical protein